MVFAVANEMLRRGKVDESLCLVKAEALGGEGGSYHYAVVEAHEMGLIKNFYKCGPRIYCCSDVRFCSRNSARSPSIPPRFARRGALGITKICGKFPFF